MLDLTEFEEKIISAVLEQMRTENDELKVKTDYSIIMAYLGLHTNLTKAIERIQ